MALQLILGGAGSGKTTLLYDELIRLSMEHPKQQFFLIVPEQFTMQTQKDIVTRHPCHGTMNIDIVSFARLAYRVFEELAVENLAVLDDMGKSMVLRKVAAAQKRQLVLFGGQLNKSGFVGIIFSWKIFFCFIDVFQRKAVYNICFWSVFFKFCRGILKK